MTSASTKRRKQRDADLLKKWTGTPIGTKVTVHRANGHTIKTVTLSEPFALHAGAYVRVQGIDGNTHLRRLTLGWDEAEYAAERLPWNHRAEKEIQRLRAAMVHAMDMAEKAGRSPMAGLWQRSVCKGIVRILKSALEKK